MGTGLKLELSTGLELGKCKGSELLIQLLRLNKRHSFLRLWLGCRMSMMFLKLGGMDNMVVNLPDALK